MGLDWTTHQCRPFREAYARPRTKRNRLPGRWWTPHHPRPLPGSLREAHCGFASSFPQGGFTHLIRLRQSLLFVQKPDHVRIDLRRKDDDQIDPRVQATVECAQSTPFWLSLIWPGGLVAGMGHLQGGWRGGGTAGDGDVGCGAGQLYEG